MKNKLKIQESLQSLNKLTKRNLCLCPLNTTKTMKRKDKKKKSKNETGM